MSLTNLNNSTNNIDYFSIFPEDCILEIMEKKLGEKSSSGIKFQILDMPFVFNYDLAPFLGPSENRKTQATQEVSISFS